MVDDETIPEEAEENLAAWLADIRERCRRGEERARAQGLTGEDERFAPWKRRGDA